MGFFGKLFGGDPEKDLEKARGFLAQNRPDRAVELARKAVSSDQEEIRVAAEQLMNEARGQLIDKALGMAATAEESEFWEDALEWLDRALEQIEDPARAQEVSARRQKLVDKLEAADEEAWQAPEPVAEAAEPAADEIGGDDLFYVLVEMLDESVGHQYQSQNVAFREAYLALHDDRVAEALPILDGLLESKPNDPALRFERGRARLSVGDPEGAREDLEVAWEEWGDIFLDRAGTLTVASLWAEVMLELKQPEAVLERLESAARPANGQPELSLPYGQALLMAERFEDGEAFLVEAMGRFPSKADFGLLLAMLLEKKGRRLDAIQCLEVSIAPSCTTGSCGRQPRHLPSFRTLAAFLLAAGGEGESDKARESRQNRAAEVLDLIREGLGGGVSHADALLRLELARQQGDEQEVASWMERAEELAKAGPQVERESMAAPKLGGEAVL